MLATAAAWVLAAAAPDEVAAAVVVVAAAPDEVGVEVDFAVDVADRRCSRGRASMKGARSAAHPPRRLIEKKWMEATMMAPTRRQRKVAHERQRRKERRWRE